MLVSILQFLKQLVEIQQQILVKLSEPQLASNCTEDELLDSVDAMNFLKISHSSLYRLRKNGGIKHKRIAGKYYFYRSSILRYHGLEE